jgi:hypothetical protein
MTIDKRIIDAYASPIKEWEANHQNDTNIILFLYEMINVAVDKTAGTKMGWKHHECGVDYDSKVIEDSLTGKKTRIVSREESAWTLGLVAFSWLTKIV